MTVNTKISKVLEYLIKNDEEKAKELLHQVFIEKARAIHEEIMSADEEMNEDFGLETEMVQGSGDQGEDLKHEISAMEDEIDFEETNMDEGDDEMSMDPDASDDDEHGEGFDAIDNKMQDLETALAELKAEFEKLEAEEHGEEDADDDDADHGEEIEMDSDDSEIEMDESTDVEEEDGEMEESWDLDEDFDDLAESLDLEVVEKNVLGANKGAAEIGSGHSGMHIDAHPTSPLPKSQTTRYGASPVETGKGGHTGYSLESAPKSADLGIGDNRRKKSTDKTSAMNAGTYGAKKVSNSKLETTASEFHTDSSKMSPLSKGGDNLK